MRIAVTDPKGERLPEPRASGSDDQFGRGLTIVQTLADRRAVERLVVGKRIWAELDIRRSPDGQPAQPSPKVPWRYLGRTAKETQMTAEWQNAMAEARAATGFTGNVIQRTVDSIGVALRLDRRAAFYGELGSLSDPGGFEASLNHWWTQALADSAPNEDAREQAIDFADVAASRHVRATGGPTSRQAEIDAIVTGAEAS